MRFYKHNPLWINFHDELIEQYMEDHPDVSEEEAREATEEALLDKIQDYIADAADHYYQLRKDDGY